MDILDIDEVLNEDSFCLLDEKNQDDVAHILQQWKEGMRDRIPKPDTRTFTRVKHKVHNNDSYNNKFTFDIDRKENTFDIDNPMNIDGQKTSIQHDTFLNDTSPPNSSCFIDGGSLNNFMTSLVTSNDFKNIGFLNSNNDIEQLLTKTTNNSTNNEIFDSLTLSGIKDFNISQTDEMSDDNSLTNFNDNQTTSDSNDETFIKDNFHQHDNEVEITPVNIEQEQQQQNQQQNCGTDKISEFIQQEESSLQDKLKLKSSNESSMNSTATSSSSSLNDLTFTKKIQPNPNFSDRTFKKSSKQQPPPPSSSSSSFIKNETYETNNDDINKFNNDNSMINNLTFNNIDLINNSFDLNDMHFSFKDTDLLEMSNNEKTNNFLPLHSTPFRNPSSSSKLINYEMNNIQPISIQEKLKMLKKDLDYDYKEEYENKKFLEYEEENSQDQDKILNDFKEIEKEIEFLENEKSEENHHQNHVDDDVVNNDIAGDYDEDDDYDDLEFKNNKEFSMNNVKMRQSLDNIKKRYFSEKNDKTLNNSCDIIMNKKSINNSGNTTDRLLTRRSRLYDNIDTIKQNSIINNGKSELERESKVTRTNNEIPMKIDNNIKDSIPHHPVENQINDMSYMNNDDKFKTMIISRRKNPNRIEKNLEYKNSLERLEDNTREIVDKRAITMTTINQQDSSAAKSHSAAAAAAVVNQTFKEPITSEIQKKPQRMLARPKYVSQYFRQNGKATSEHFQKANSAGELHKDNFLNERKQSVSSTGSGDSTVVVQKTIDSTMRNKAKSLHNLAVGNIPDNNRYFKVKPEPPPPPSSPYAQSRLGQQIGEYDGRKPTKFSTVPKAISNTVSNLRPVTSRTTRLMRPSSGYYSYNTKDDDTTESGSVQSLSMNPPLNTKIGGIIVDKKNIVIPSPLIDSTSELNLKNGINCQQQQSVNSNNSKIPAKVRRSGLPRPSNVIKR